MKIEISIIIANYNGEYFLPTCLVSLIKYKPKNSEILIVDDCSADKSVIIIEKLQRSNKFIKLIKNANNLGAAESRNIAITKALGEIIIFIDNDTEVTPLALDKMVSKLKDNKVGAVQALLVDFNNRNLIQNGGGLLIPQVAWLAPFFQKQEVNLVKSKDIKIIAISACLAVKASVLKVVGGFDKDLSVYTEDLDFSWRLWIAGWQIILCNDAIVFHWTKSVEKRKTMNATYKQIYYHLAKNSFTSITKNYEMINLIRFLPVSILINFGRATFLLVFKRKAYALYGTIEALIWFVVNFGKIISKRKAVQLTRKTSDANLFKVIFNKDSLLSNYKKYFQ